VHRLSYRVEYTSLNTKLDRSKDREIEAVDSGEASSTWIKEISTFWVIDVVLQPSSTESFLYAIESTTSSPSVFNFTFFFLSTLMWTYHLKLMLSSDNDASVIFFVPHASC
jgi:hypothetical protein